MKSSNGLYEAHVLIRGKTEATEVVHDSNTYIEGRKGTEYILRFKNWSNKRVLVLPSVDGLSVLDGKNAGIQSPGYVINAHSQMDIPGWKVNSSTAAKFIFAEKGSRSSNPAKQTYAEQQGTDPRNIGVIGFAVFAEKEAAPPPPPKTVYVPYPVYVPPYTPPVNPWQWPNTDPYRVTYGPSTSIAGAMGSVSGSALGQFSNTSTLNATPESLNNATPIAPSAPEPSMGTGFGEATRFNTTAVTFVRANENTPEAVLTLIYDSLTNLEQLGVPMDLFRPNRPSLNRNPFPASPELTGSGCTPPKGWPGPVRTVWSTRKRR